MMKGILRFLPGVVAILLAVCPRAHATLGESVETVEADRSYFSALKKSVRHTENFTIHTIDSGGTAIREYVSSSGMVFGVAWSGLIHPDLTLLLGSYFGEYQAAERETRRMLGVRRRAVQGSHVVVEKWGHMRSLQGRAYDPALIPAGVEANDIQ